MRLCTAPSSLCFGALRSPSEDNFAFSILILHKITHAAQSNSACALELQLEQPRFSLTPFVPRQPFFSCLLGTLPASRDSPPLPSNHTTARSTGCRCQSGLTGNRACRGTSPGSHSKTAGPGAWPSGRLFIPTWKGLSTSTRFCTCRQSPPNLETTPSAAPSSRRSRLLCTSWSSTFPRLRSACHMSCCPSASTPPPTKPPLDFDCPCACSPIDFLHEPRETFLQHISSASVHTTGLVAGLKEHRSCIGLHLLHAK